MFSVSPEHLFAETQVEADTLGSTLLIRRGDGGELAVPGLAALIPAGDLKGEMPILMAVLQIVWFTSSVGKVLQKTN